MALFLINIATYVKLNLTAHKLPFTVCFQINNPLAHELTTAPEIIEAVTSTTPSLVHPSSGKVDVFVGGAGTGGTLSGVARGIKKAHNPDCVVVGVDPVCVHLVTPVDFCLHALSLRLVRFSPCHPL